jgi:hypothetical protein
MQEAGRRINAQAEGAHAPAWRGKIGGCALAIVIVALSLAGCLTVPETYVRLPPGTGSPAVVGERQARILDAAREMLATQVFVVDGYQYAYDCTGTILAIYAMAGINLVDLFPRYTGNGVTRLYSIADDRGLLYHTEYPQPGDLIFWDNTYDKNGDKRWNDSLTHVGLVLSVARDGTVEYLHHHYTDGVVIARMNLRDPSTHVTGNGVVVNSPMRMRSHRYLNPDQWLASHLYRRLGALYRIEL